MEHVLGVFGVVGVVWEVLGGVWRRAALIPDPSPDPAGEGSRLREFACMLGGWHGPGVRAEGRVALGEGRSDG